MKSNLANNKKLFPLKISLIYFILGCLWILISDNFMLLLSKEIYDFYQVSITKGRLFIIITSILLYILLRRDMNVIFIQKNN